jgi:predicted RNA binding protein YcfA (HicA-like mRNA interferase family)
MAKLAPVRPGVPSAYFRDLGFREAGQEGSHLKMKKPGARRPLIIPMHRTVSVGVILSNLRSAGSSRQHFEEWLGKKKLGGD